ncbi:hypothetical protein B6D19_12935 [Gilliamella apicola]|uniref:hypothetical protein n=1 Tax=Gilliamella apicola TaxID=1196095 RepID=UPI000A35B5C0|nr:hypothetical protein [Gilliamella apicola]OTQ28508.1 hypothetical protein B6D19_12935 [Gilliamella apicola]OTQ38091.1 hypothetical protein B6D20_11960 [Gilliamella apicola]
MAKYSLLKGKVSKLHVFDDHKEIRSDDIGWLALFGLMIIGAFELIIDIIDSLAIGNITLKGKTFYCYIGKKEVLGNLEHVGFKEGDYVEMVVKKIDSNQYQSYAVQMPQYHALYFPRSIGVPTLLKLKFCSIVSGVMCLFAYLFLTILAFFDLEKDPDDFIFRTIATIIMFLLISIILFFLAGGRYSFISNRIFATLGYPKPWLHSSVAEHDRFKKLNRSGDPELYDDPQTPEFERIKKLDPDAYYYCRTPNLPDWVEVIDERGYTTNLKEQKELSS